MKPDVDIKRDVECVEIITSIDFQEGVA